MKLLLRNGDVREQHLESAICGLPVRELTLDAHDFALLWRMRPEHQLAWIERLSMRFAPVDPHFEMHEGVSASLVMDTMAGPNRGRFIIQPTVCRRESPEGVSIDNPASCLAVPSPMLAKIRHCRSFT